MLIYVKFCTNQSSRQLSPCYSRPWLLKSSFVSLAVCLFFRIVLFLCMTVPCNQTSSYGIFFMGREKDFQLVLWLAAEQYFQSLSFKLSLLYSEIVQGMSGQSEQIYLFFLYSCLWLEALNFWSRYYFKFLQSLL